MRLLALTASLALAGCAATVQEPSADAKAALTAHQPPPDEPLPPFEPTPTEPPREVTMIPPTISRPRLQFPDRVRQRLRGQGSHRFTGKVCLATNGHPYRIDVLRGVEGADDTIIANLRRWVFEPQPSPACFSLDVMFHLE